MKIEYLKEFVALAQMLNFHLAAEKMYVTDSALSRHILSIENELGTKLFYRDTKTVRLTKVGEVFLHEIQSILLQYDKLCSNITMQIYGYQHSLKLALPYYAVTDFLGDAHYFFSLHNKDVVLDYTVRSPMLCLNALLQDEVDATICSFYPFMEPHQLEKTRLFYEPLIVVMAPSHPLAYRDSLTLSDLRNETLLTIETPYHREVWSHYLYHFEMQGISSVATVRLRQIESVQTACLSSKGVYITPWHMRQHLSKSLTYVPLNEQSLCREICILSHRKKTHPALKYLIKAFESVGTYGWTEIAPTWPEKLGWKEV